MTRRFETRTGAARAASSIFWALGCGALLGALACQKDAEPSVHGEPARAPSAPAASPASAPAAPSAASTASDTLAPSGASPSAPSGQVGLAKYQEASPAAPAARGEASPTSAPSSSAASATTPSPVADAPQAAAGQPVKGTVVDGETFATWLQAASPVTAGGPATVEAVLVAKAGYHCNADYPHKFKLGAAPAGLSYPEATVKGMQVTPERSVLRIPVVAQSPGKPTVAGTLQFSVCNDERCLIEKRELALNLEVK